MSHLQRPFVWFYWGRFASLLGSSMTPVALTFAVVGASNRPLDLGVILAANVIPHLLLLLVGGATADRFSRRTVLVTANLGSAITQGAVAAVLMTGHYGLAVVAALEFANGVLAAFTGPALRGVLPELVGPQALQKANARVASTGNAIKIVGPTVAGMVVAGIGGGPAIAFDAATFALAALCLLRLPHRSANAIRTTRLRHDIKVGWTYFRSVRWLWPVSVAFFVVNLAQTGPWQILGPEIVHVSGGPRDWGLVLSARAVGLLIMSGLMHRLTVRHPLRVTVLAGSVAALPLMGIGLGLPTSALMAAAIMGGAGSAASAISWDTALQQRIPGDRLSRVASIDDLLSFAAIPVGQLAAGPLASTYSAHGVCLVAGATGLIAAALPIGNSAVRGLTNRPPKGPSEHRPA